MPTYEYECTKCGHTFEAFQSMSDALLVRCPSCARKGLRRLIGGGLAVIFKGSGFYVTDSRGGNGSGNGKNGKGSGESADASKPAGDSGSSDASTTTGSSSGSSKKDAAATQTSSDSKAKKPESGSKTAK